MFPSTSFDQIRAAKARYCRFADTKQWQAFTAVFIARPEILIYDAADQLLISFDTREAFSGAARDYLEGTQSIHQIHNEELTQVSATEVHAIWSMEDCVIFPDVADDPRPARHHGYGHYHERWVLEDGLWRLARLELRRTILEITPKQPLENLS
ncbi:MULTISPECIES: nuclear transport factor 2 family protein [unclassified Duganella]|jgi:hypothetical protein|uniref:nuclear transport factor 2 family protein n=1 Tax=unclassified Duganella TaxID=2636909 RepID=UPI00087E56FC|nr:MULTISPECIES: nuclear transport factor 2 family protein [unclassified Duganella]SDH15445.1 SnoaL-like domain-containing protein [Duganella sp. OV458]SDK29959.1 SnoaL-like domain-containing protein [Duganella sp. OV510]